MTADINTGADIRPTNNTPKERDDFQVSDQYARPMTEEEIKSKIDALIGTEGDA